MHVHLLHQYLVRACNIVRLEEDMVLLINVVLLSFIEIFLLVLINIKMIECQMCHSRFLAGQGNDSLL